jgi:hypothetical protein
VQRATPSDFCEVRSGVLVSLQSNASDARSGGCSERPINMVDVPSVTGRGDGLCSPMLLGPAPPMS